MKRYLFIVILSIMTATMQAGLRNFPFSEDFDSTQNFPGTTMPDGWSFEDTNADNVTWDILTPVDPSYAHSQPNSMHMAFGIYQSMNDWLFTPALELNSADSYQLSFWVRCGLDIFTGNAAPEKIRVSIGTESTSQAMTMELYVDELVDNMDYEQVVLDFQVSVSGDYYIGFQSFSDPESFILAIDDIYIEEFTSTTDQVINPPVLGNFPNPFNPQTTITYDLKDISWSEIEVYNAKGQIVDSIPVDNSKSQVIWNAEKQPSGIYFYRLKEQKSPISKMILMK